MASPLPGSTPQSQTGRQLQRISTDSPIPTIHIIRTIISLPIDLFIVQSMTIRQETSLGRLFLGAQHETQQSRAYNTSDQWIGFPKNTKLGNVLLSGGQLVGFGDFFVKHTLFNSTLMSNICKEKATWEKSP